MAADDSSTSCNDWIEIELIEVVKQIEMHIAKLDNVRIR